MADKKNDDAKGHHVNIKRNTDSIGKPDTMFEWGINNQNKSLERTNLVIEEPSFPVKRLNTH